MLANPLPFVILGLVVVATLAWKGYLPNPLTRKPARFEPSCGPSVNAAQTAIPMTPNRQSLADDLATQYGSRTLGLAFAIAKRREAEQELAHTIAQQAGDQIAATFTAPFSPPASDGPPATGGA